MERYTSNTTANIGEPDSHARDSPERTGHARVDDDLDAMVAVNGLNQALAVTREVARDCQRQYLAALRHHSPAMAAAALEHANVAQVHMDRLSSRIADLGGTQDRSAEAQRPAVRHGAPSLAGVIGDHLLLQRTLIESYRAIGATLAPCDASIRAMIADIIAVERECAEALATLLGTVKAA